MSSVVAESRFSISSDYHSLKALTSSPTASLKHENTNSAAIELQPLLISLPLPLTQSMTSCIVLVND